MNKHIIGSKIILFLGAGSSQFLDKPLMTSFVDVLIDSIQDAEFKKIINTIVEREGKDLETLLHEIDGICERTYFKGARQNYLKDRLGLHTQLGLLAVYKYKSEAPSKSDFGEKYANLCRDCESLKWLIYDKIFEVYFDIDKIKTTKLYEPLFNILKSALGKKLTIPIFTTNYDKSIEFFSDTSKAIELVDGFEINSKTKTHVLKRSVFEKFKPKKRKINICLFKLHGSIFWYKVDGETVYSPVSTQTPSVIDIEPVILYPNNTKQITYDPFITSYCYLQRSLDRAEYAIFIGYSFRDDITVTFLKNALRFNNKLRVVLIDPNANNLFEKHFKFYKHNFICVDKKFTDKAEYQEELLKALNLRTSEEKKV